MVLDLIFMGSVLYLTRNMPQPDGGILFLAILAGVWGLRYFVDMIARNFFLHRLDWETAGPDDPHG